MPDYLVIAFYTKATPYEDEVKKVEADCAALGLDFHKTGYPNTGKWVRNAGLKPLFIGAMLNEFPGRNLLYVDADARIHSVPKFPEGDVGVHYRRGTELLSGTIFLRSNAKVKKLVHDWAEHQGSNLDTWDQKTLQHVLERSRCEVTRIPPSYTQIFDTMAHHGKPVIEHFQASRKYKKIVEGRVTRYPRMIGKVRIREANDGSIYIVRRDKVAEAWLDKNASRLRGQLRWIPVFDELLKIEHLREHFDGKTCYIVGKGPSLDYLSAEHFGEGPIIGLNEAAKQVGGLGLDNKLFMLQQDAKLRNTCYVDDTTLLVSIKAANFYADRQDVYIFDSRHYRLSLNSLSVSAAVEIAKKLGAKNFVMVCFDACVTGSLEYALCVGYKVTWGGNPRRFTSHRKKIEERVKGFPTQWLIPKDPAGASSDRPRR